MEQSVQKTPSLRAQEQKRLQQCCRLRGALYISSCFHVKVIRIIGRALDISLCALGGP